jgi:clan AA aspartic protease (TIGR02281 family)
MEITYFNRNRDLIVVEARLWSPRHDKWVSLVVDTGSSDTVVTPDLVEKLGYSVRDGEHVTTVRSAIGKEHGWMLRVKRFAALSFVVPDYRVHVFDLATGDDIDGLIGLSYLDQFNYEVRSRESRLRVERAAGAQ